MGNYRFRLSAMIPNAWFYKLKDMNRGGGGGGGGSKRVHHSHSGAPPPPGPKSFPSPTTTTTNNNNQSLLPSRASYYYSSRDASSPIHPKASDTHFPIDPPRKSRRNSRRKPISPTAKLTSSSVSTGCSCRSWRTDYLPAEPPDSPPSGRSVAAQLDLDGLSAWSPSCSCRLTSSATDIFIDVAGKDCPDDEPDVAAELELELKPILTKPRPANKEAKQSKLDSTARSSVKKPNPGIHRLRMRATSPKLASKKGAAPASRGRRSIGSAAKQRKGLSESFAVVKSSRDPQRDFKDSMMEMIVENDLRASKDLEELLACYLSLNSDEYHDVIVKVFKQIWFDLTELRL